MVIQTFLAFLELQKFLGNTCICSLHFRQLLGVDFTPSVTTRSDRLKLRLMYLFPGGGGVLPYKIDGGSSSYLVPFRSFNFVN